MASLGKDHNPRNNEELIASYFTALPDMETILQETEDAYNSIRSKTFAETKGGRVAFWSAGYWLEKAWQLFSEKAPQDEEDIPGSAEPPWKAALDKEYGKLTETEQVDVTDFGAVGDGRKDCTDAFRRAIGKGNVTVFVPEGIYKTKGIQLPDRTRLVGQGKGLTVIRLHDKAPKRRRLLTNRHYRRGNRHISVERLTLDWNVERLGNAAKTNTWGNFSSCLVFANVTYGWVKEVEAINAGLHGFDLSAPLYSYAGDGRRARGGSRYIWIDGASGYGFGDDGLTTHHSDHIFISRCHFCDPSGKAHRKGFSNSNGIEIDDGSRYVWLLYNTTARCFGGVEIKAHHNSSAASNVHIYGHLSVNDNRSFNFRHIGHHKGEDPQSQTARNIRAQLLVSAGPVPTNLYKGSSPRSLVISAYRNVAINRFRFIGDPGTDYGKQPAVSVQYRAGRVSLTNGIVERFGNSVSVAQGKDGAAEVVIQHVRSTGD